MRNLLVCSYFCPALRLRAGGVQHVVGPLVDGLRDLGYWHVVVAHPGHCEGTQRHEVLPHVSRPGEPDQVDPDCLAEFAHRYRALAADVDVILSIDRVLPVSGATPRILMSNTLAYLTEASAVTAGRWTQIVVPTKHFARRIRAVDPAARICVVTYGLHPSVISHAASLPSPGWEDPVLVLRLPHRPDPRKGHFQAIDGLARALPASSRVQLEIAWLDEQRYSSFRRGLEEAAAALGVTTQVRFRSWLDDDERWDAMEAAHGVLQVGSFEETFGLALVEAVLAGRAAITSVQPAVREVIGANPLFVEVEDPVVWYGQFERAIRAPAMSAPDSPNAQLIRSLSLDRMVDQYDTLLRTASEGNCRSQ